jgi:hypothetical protein
VPLWRCWRGSTYRESREELPGDPRQAWAPGQFVRRGEDFSISIAAAQTERVEAATDNLLLADGAGGGALSVGLA